MKLYELRAEYEALMDAARGSTDPDEVQAFEDTLTGLRGEIVDKLHACCIVVRTLDVEAGIFAEEAERMVMRRRALDARADRLRAYMTVEMALMDMKKVQTPLFTVTLQSNKPRLVVTDESALPPSAWVTPAPKVSNEAVRLLLASGPVPGAHLEPSQSVRIK